MLKTKLLYLKEKIGLIHFPIFIFSFLILNLFLVQGVTMGNSNVGGVVIQQPTANPLTNNSIGNVTYALDSDKLDGIHANGFCQNPAIATQDMGGYNINNIGDIIPDVTDTRNLGVDTTNRFSAVYGCSFGSPALGYYMDFCSGQGVLPVIYDTTISNAFDIGAGSWIDGISGNIIDIRNGLIGTFNFVTNTMVLNLNMSGYNIINVGTYEGDRVKLGSYASVCNGNGSITSEGLVLYYNFDNAANRLEDTSPNSNNGTSAGTVSYVAGKVGTAIKTEDALAKVGLTSAVVLNTESTLAGWYKLKTGTQVANYNPIWGSDGANELYYGYDTGNYIDGVYGGIHPFGSTTGIDNNNWHFVVITDDGASIKIYIDGLDAGNSRAYNTLAGFTITRTNQGYNDNNFKGLMDELTIWNRTLSLSEILSLGGCAGVVDTGESILTTGNGRFLGNVTASNVFANNICYRNGTGCNDTFVNKSWSQGYYMDTNLNMNNYNITNLNVIKDNSNKLAIDIASRKFYNSLGTSATADFNSRTLSNNVPVTTLNWLATRLYDDDGVAMYDWNDGVFYKDINITGITNLNNHTNIKGNIVQTNGNATINNYYGSVYNFSDTGWNVGIKDSAVYYNLTISTIGELNGFRKIDVALTNETKLQALQGGLYAVDAVITGEFAAGEYGLGAVTNGANPEVLGRCYTRTNMNAEYAVPLTCFKRLSAGDNVTLVIDDEGSPTKEVKIHNINLRLMRIGN